MGLRLMFRECAICEDVFDVAAVDQNVVYGYCYPVNRFYAGSDVHKVLERHLFICGACFFDAVEEQHANDRAIRKEV